jgi:O-methyltransferase involved in polyketide biosynthesis
MEIDDNKFSDVMPTAILTAYPRTFSDIPYSQEIFDEIHRSYGVIEDELMVTRIAVELEARSKLIDRLLGEQGTSQVIELAAGFSSRGLLFAQTAETQYVEIDLPEIAYRKKAILDNITTVPDDLHIIGGNALRRGDFDEATKYFDVAKRVTIINEGLLRYLDFDEKAEVARNIRAVLEEFGGVWISGDGATKQFRNSQNQRVPSVNTTLMNTTQRNNMGNAFESQAHFEQFFGELGFTVEFHDYTEVINELTSPGRLGLSEDDVRDKLLSYASAIVLRLK